MDLKDPAKQADNIYTLGIGIALSESKERKQTSRTFRTHSLVCSISSNYIDEVLTWRLTIMDPNTQRLAYSVLQLSLFPFG